MKITRSLALFLSATLALTVSHRAFAQSTALDIAANYTNGWHTGDNFGTGFQAWNLQNNQDTNTGAYAGFYIGSSGVAAIDTTNKAFGIYANGTGYNEAVAYRGISNALNTSVVFKLKFKNNFVSIPDQGMAGFSLRSGTAPASTNSPDGIVPTSRFSIYFFGGQSDYYIFDSAGATDTGIGFRTSGLSLEFTLRTADTYRLVIKDAAGQNVLATFDNRSLGGNTGEPINAFACYALDTGDNGDVHFNSFEVAPASTIAPIISNVQPANGGIFLSVTNQISFDVSSPFSGVATNGITLTLNGTNQTGLSFTGDATARHVVMTTPLQANLVYNAVIVAADVNGNRTTNSFSFNTWSQNLHFVEAEDYNFGGGGFIAAPLQDEYANVITLASNGVDALEFTDGGTNVYRPQDIVDVETNADISRTVYTDQGLSDYNLSFIQFNEWENYTRRYSNVTCAVYARLASLSGNPTMLLERLANPTATSSNQLRASLGTFVCPANTGGAQSYAFVPLTDFFSNPVLVKFNGTNTLRTTRIGGGYNLNYLLFVPSTATNTLRPYVTAGYPYPAAAGVAPDVKIHFEIANRTTLVVPSSIRLFLNSTEVTSSITLVTNAAGTEVSYQVQSLLPNLSTNTISVIYSDNGTPSIAQTNQWQFTVANIMIVPPAYALPPGSASTRGFNIHIVKAPNEAPSDLFVASSQRAENHLAGLIIDTNTSLAFTNEAAGPNGDGRYQEPNVINYNQAGTIVPDGGIGLFTNDSPFPYVATSKAGSYTNDPNYFSMEAITYLELSAGIYRWAVRSDDGFRFTIGNAPMPTNFLVMDYEGGRGLDDPSNPSTFDFIIQTSGVYPARLLYYEGAFGSSLEWYSVNRTNGDSILINDTANISAIKAYQTSAAAPAPVLIRNPARSGGVVTFNFLTQSGHTHAVKYKNTLNDALWQTLTNVTGNGSTANIVDNSASGPSRFYTVWTQ